MSDFYIRSRVVSRPQQTREESTYASAGVASGSAIVGEGVGATLTSFFNFCYKHLFADLQAINFHPHIKQRDEGGGTLARCLLREAAIGLSLSILNRAMKRPGLGMDAAGTMGGGADLCHAGAAERGSGRRPARTGSKVAIADAVLLVAAACFLCLPPGAAGRYFEDPILGEIDLRLDFSRELVPFAGAPGRLWFLLDWSTSLGHSSSVPYDTLPDFSDGYDFGSVTGEADVMVDGSFLVSIPSIMVSVGTGELALDFGGVTFPDATNDVSIVVKVTFFGVDLVEEFRCRPVGVEKEETYVGLSGGAMVELMFDDTMDCPIEPLLLGETGELNADASAASRVEAGGTSAEVLAVVALVVGIIAIAFASYLLVSLRRAQDSIRDLQRALADSKRNTVSLSLGTRRNRRGSVPEVDAIRMVEDWREAAAMSQPNSASPGGAGSGSTRSQGSTVLTLSRSHSGSGGVEKDGTRRRPALLSTV